MTTAEYQKQIDSILEFCYINRDRADKKAKALQKKFKITDAHLYEDEPMTAEQEKILRIINFIEYASASYEEIIENI